MRDARRQEKDAMTMLELTTSAGPVPVYVATPDGVGPWPGVVVLHDALGMTADLRHQADWLASVGYLAAAPDLYHRHPGRLRCMFGVISDVVRRHGAAFEAVEATRRWLVARDDCTGQVGTIGFCMGGGFALLLAASGDYGAASINYGAVPKDALELLEGACPIVASYGGKDRGLARAPERLESALNVHGIAHDITVYPEAGHAFLNDHDPDEVPRWAMVMGALSTSEYHQPSALDARRRIRAFFDTHLKAPRG
jgi:carboxymethylenebutenolidase